MSREEIEAAIQDLEDQICDLECEGFDKNDAIESLYEEIAELENQLYDIEE